MIAPHVHGRLGCNGRRVHYRRANGNTIHHITEHRGRSDQRRLDGATDGIPGDRHCDRDQIRRTRSQGHGWGDGRPPAIAAQGIKCDRIRIVPRIGQRVRVNDRPGRARPLPVRRERKQRHDVDIVGLCYRVRDKRICLGIRCDPGRVHDRTGQRAGHRDRYIDRGGDIVAQDDLGRHHGDSDTQRAVPRKADRIRVPSRVGHGVGVRDRIAAGDKPAVARRKNDLAPDKLVRADVRSGADDARLAIHVLRDRRGSGNVGDGRVGCQVQIAARGIEEPRIDGNVACPGARANIVAAGVAPHIIVAQRCARRLAIHAAACDRGAVADHDRIADRSTAPVQVEATTALCIVAIDRIVPDARTAADHIDASALATRRVAIDGIVPEIGCSEPGGKAATPGRSIVGDLVLLDRRRAQVIVYPTAIGSRCVVHDLVVAQDRRPGGDFHTAARAG